MLKFLPIQKILTLYLFLGFISNYTFSQSIRLFTTDSELSSSLIHQVYQDSKGIIWVATEDGLNRYDGAKFTIFKKEDSNNLSAPHNYVKTIFESRSGKLFMGFFNGLRIFDRSTQSFYKVPLIMDNGEDFPSHVSSIVDMPDGSILIGTAGQGLFELKPNSKKAYRSNLNELIDGTNISKIFFDANQHLWIATDSNGLYRIDPKRNTQLFLKACKTQDVIISDIIENSATGEIYVGSLNKGLLKYNKTHNLFEAISTQDGTFKSVKALQFLNPNQILIGTDGDGLKVYETEKNKISPANYNLSNINLSKAKIHSLTKDKSGNIWLGIFQKGVLLIPSKTNNFQYIGFKSPKRNIIGSSAILSIYKQHNGNLLIGTDGEGLFGITLEGNQLFHMGPQKDFPQTVTTVFEDSNNQVWVGSFLNGMFKVHTDEGTFERFTALEDPDANSVKSVYDITEDHNKNLWIGTMGSGLFSMNLPTGKVTHYPGIDGENYDEQKGALPNRWINCLKITKDHKLYIGTYDGLACFDLETKSFIDPLGRNRVLAGNIIHSIYEDSRRKVIWIGTSEGLVKHPINSDIFERYTIEDGLPNNVICSINSDKENHLWISTNHGLSKFQPEEKSFVNYYFNDGLQGNEFSKNSSYSNQKDQIILGGLHGLTHFTTTEINDQSRAPKVKITGLYIQDKKVLKGIKSGRYQIIDTTLSEAKTFDLAHGDNSFSFEFSTRDFDNPDNITYAYSMKNGEWVTLPQGVNSVAFNNLDPGEYILRVKAKDYHHFSDPISRKIIIHPAWYFSDWALITYIFIILIAVGAFLYFLRQRQINRQKIREHEKNREINDAKLKLFTDISHDLKTPISLILNPLEKLEKADQDSSRQKSYKIMRRNSERILKLMNQLMDVSKLSNGEISAKFTRVNILECIRESSLIFEDIIHSKKIQLTFHNELAEYIVEVDVQLFEKVIQNVLSNAIKFTPEGGKISISVDLIEEPNDSTGVLEKYCQIIISDTGKGIEKEHLSRIFERFYQAPGASQDRVEGTGVGLHLSKSIIELHMGKISAENRTDSPGSNFIIKLPVTQDKLDSASKHVELKKAQETSLPGPSESLNTEDGTCRRKSSQRILVVDDDEEIRDYIKEELKSCFELLEAPNPKEAFPIVMKHKPDLIISDVVMPGMNGFQFCKKIKQNVLTNHIPIILLTGKSGEDSNLEGLSKGADAYISKPFNMEILKNTVTNLIKNRELLRNNFLGNQEHSEKVKDVQLKSSDEKLIQKTIDIINQNMDNSELNVEMIAEEIGISRVHLYRKLKELTNQSARDFIKNIRLEQAARLLSSKHQHQVSEVAYATGFTNVSTFSRNFKAQYGVNPKEYKNSEANQMVGTEIE